MASFGGYIRFYLGILLALEVFRIAIFNQPISQLAILLASLYIASSALYFIKRVSGYA